MKYKLLDNFKGVLLLRAPEISNDMLTIEFEGTEKGYTAIFECEYGPSFYRELKEGICKIPIGALNGVISVCVTDTGASELRKKWLCERLLATKSGSDTVITPYYEDIEKVLSALCIENSAIREELMTVKKEIQSVNERIDKMMEGYELI